MRRLYVFLLCSLSACGSSDKIGGELSVDSEMHGSWSMSPTTCISGQNQQFLGVDLIEGDDEEHMVRIVDDPLQGYSLGMNVPGQDFSLVIRAPASECEVFDLLVERGNTRINGIWAMQGHANIECHTEGLDIVADLHFSGCT